MVKADLARIVHQKHGGISYQEAQQLVQLVLDLVKTNLSQGKNVKLTGFGTLKVVQRKARLGRNPQTGDRIPIASSRSITFKPSRLLNF